MASSNQTTIPMPSPNADAATQWAYLEEGLHHMMNEPQNVPYAKYMALYTVCYNYCNSIETHKEGRTNEMRVGASFMGRDLYEKVTGFLEAYLNALKPGSESLQDEALLQYYARVWDQYTAGTRYMNRLFTYLNRHWVKPERDQGKKSIYPVYTLALVQWRTNFLPHIQSGSSKLTGATLQLIENHRNGQEIDQGLVKKVVDSFVSLGIDEGDLQRVTLDVYQEHFETPFLEATEKHYRAESGAFLAKYPILDYVKKVEEWLREEGDRAERYLDARTKEPLISRCEGVLIEERSELIRGSFQSSPDHTDEDIQRVHALLARVSDGPT